MNISIGSMHSSVLGVATSNSAAASITKASGSSSVSGAGAVEGLWLKVQPQLRQL